MVKANKNAGTDCVTLQFGETVSAVAIEKGADFLTCLGRNAQLVKSKQIYLNLTKI